MEKQHNRGQDGAGIATVKLDIEAGNPFLYRLRSSAQQPIADIFYKVGQEIQELEKLQSDITKHPGLMKGHLPFILEAAQGDLTRPLDEEMNRDIAEFGVTPLFDGAALDRI